MPRKPNKVLRIVVPLVAIAVGLIAVSAFVRNAANPRTAPRPAPVATTPTTPGADRDEQPTAPPARAEAPAPEIPVAEAPAAQPPTPEPTPAPTGEPFTEPAIAAAPDPAPSAPRATPGTLTARTLDGPIPAELRPIGSLGLRADHEMRVRFTPFGAGVREIRLARHFESVRARTRAHQGEDPVPEEDFVLIQTEQLQHGLMLAPMMILRVEIDGQYVDLTGFGRPGPIWDERAPGHFVATIVDDQDRPAFEVERVYTLEPASFDISVRTRVVNRTDQPAVVRLEQYGPVELVEGDVGYGGDIRRVRFGYIVEQADPGRQQVLSDQFLWRQQSREVLGRRQTERFANGVTGEVYPQIHPLWPNRRSASRGLDLVWAAFTNRYFGVAVHPSVAPGHTGPIPGLGHVAETIDRVLLDRGTGSGMAMRLVSPRTPVAPGASARFDTGVYAGPMSKGDIRADARAGGAGVDALVLYNFGGMCAPCTFPVLTNLLFSILIVLHNHVVFDWALAIILLVVVVRTILHPVTRWSQVRMQRFGKQMQAMAPKQKKLQEKYKDDPKRMQQEMRKLWAEEGVSPAGLLGCLPMFLQSPVWIALFATLFFAVELRHQPAFFGLFQQFGGWQFLGDLAAPDALIKFGVGFSLPWKGEINSVNILPLLLGVVFFFHQKYLTPPTPNMTPEQEQQQKIIKVMTVVLFPIIMYTAPSGLALYFITNSVLAIFETRWIRSSAEKKGLLDPELIKQRKLEKRANPNGFMARMQAAAEQAQAMREQREAARGKPGASPPGAGKSKQLRPSKPDPIDPNRRFKRRK